jgi:hypothetical protein
LDCSFTARPFCPKCRSERGQDCSLPSASHAGLGRSAPYTTSPHSRELSIGSVAVRAESVNPTEVLTRLDFGPRAPKITGAQHCRHTLTTSVLVLVTTGQEVAPRREICLVPSRTGRCWSPISTSLPLFSHRIALSQTNPQTPGKRLNFGGLILQKLDRKIDQIVQRRQ